MKGSINASSTLSTYNFMATPAISAATEPIKTDLELEVLIKIADKNTTISPD